MDEGDRAQALNDLHLRHSLRRWQSAQLQGAGRTHCINCEEEIPMKRRAANPAAIRCIDCQSDHEARR